MFFLAGSKGNYVPVDSGTWCGYDEPWERINMEEHCSSTEFSSAAEI